MRVAVRYRSVYLLKPRSAIKAHNRDARSRRRSRPIPLRLRNAGCSISYLQGRYSCKQGGHISFVQSQTWRISSLVTDVAITVPMLHVRTFRRANLRIQRQCKGLASASVPESGASHGQSDAIWSGHRAASYWHPLRV